MHRIDKLPIRARPDGLQKLCNHLKEGGKETSDIVSDMAYDEDFVSENLRYGSILGFVQNNNNFIKLTDRGVKLAYESGISRGTEALFIESLKEDNIYFDILEKISDGERFEDNTIRRSDVIRIILNSYEDIEFEENQLESASRTLFMTMEAAGFGEYKLRRGNKESRIILREGIALHNIVEDDVDDLARPGLSEDSEGTFLEGFDDQLRARIEPQFSNGFYHDALGTAYTVLEDRIRNAGGFKPEDHGKDLMSKALDKDSGPLAMGVLDSEREGFKIMYMGAYQSLRNPPSHRLLDDMDYQQAKDALSMVNFLLTLVENQHSS